MTLKDVLNTDMKVNQIFCETPDRDTRRHDASTAILKKLCDLISDGQRERPEYFGMVAACVVDPQNNKVFARNHLNRDGHRTHAERAAIEAYEKKYGDLPRGSIVVTTLSPCSEHMSDREGQSCTDYLNSKRVKMVYCGYLDPTQKKSSDDKRKFDVRETHDKTIKDMCKTFASTFLDLR